MSLQFRPIEAEDIETLAPFFGQRPNKTCDSVFLESFLWRKYYHVRFAISGGKAIQWLKSSALHIGIAPHSSPLTLISH